MKVTIALRDEELYRAVKVAAAHSGRQIRDVVGEALNAWLEAHEDAEDVATSREALEDYASVGGLDADSYFERLIAEGRVTYETDTTR